MAVIYLDRPVQEGDPIGSVYDPTRSTLQNNNSLQNFESFVVTNPDLVDEGIDVSGLRTTTDTSPYLLGGIPDYEGIQYEAYNPNRLTDLMRLYSSGLPTTATDTAQIPGAVDTLVDVGSGDGGQATASITTPTSGGVGVNTPEQQRLIDEGIGVQLELGSPVSSPYEGMPPTQEEIDDFNAIPVSSDPFLVSGAAGGASLEDIDLDLVDLGNPTGDPRIVPEEQETEGPPYGINPNTGEPYQTPRTIADQNAVLGQTFEQQKDPGFWETARNNFIQTGEDIGGFFANLGNQGIDLGQLAGTTILNLAGKALTGIPLLGTAASLIGGALPPRDPRQTALDEFYTTGEGAQYLDPSSPNYIPGMENYNIVSGSDTLNKLTGGRLIDETTYGLEEAYQDRIDTINESLNKFDKYNPNHPDYDPAKTKELTDRLKNLEEAKAKESDILSLYEGDIQETGDARIAEQIATAEREAAIERDRIAKVTRENEARRQAEIDRLAAEARARAVAAQNQGSGNGGGSGSGDKSGGRSSSSGESEYGGFCFDPNTFIQMVNGSEKKIKDIQLGDQTKGGEVTGVFQFKASDEIHDYKGVTVAGSHYVKEDGRFIMVKDSPLAVKIDKIPVVYSLDTTGRRIFINNIEFADYNGDGVAKNFLTNAGVELTGFDTEVLRQVEQRLI